MAYTSFWFLRAGRHSRKKEPMRTQDAVFAVALGVVVIAAAMVAWAARHPEIDPLEQPPTFDDTVVAKGAMLASLGNCATCHTTEAGASFAGGLDIPTPFGIVRSSNITPDESTGIGHWPETAFRRAMRDGVDREGNYLYPAFPYDHFTLASDDDIAAIYAYLMSRPPVENDVAENQLPFPLNIRMLVAGWNLLYLDRGPYQADGGQGDQWNRGAYLVMGLGHCGSCHTPRNALGAEIEDRLLAGGFAEGWVGPALDATSPAPAGWTVAQLASFLRDGWAEAHGSALGPMAEVAANTARLPDEDIAAMATFLASLQPEVAEHDIAAAVEAAGEREWSPLQLSALDGADDAIQDPGEAVFAGACALCHRKGGRLPISRPVPLALSTAVAMDDPTNFLQVVLHGVEAHDPPGTTMPAFAAVLDDAQLADLANYVRRHFTDEPAWTDLDRAIDNARRGRDAENLALGNGD